jgi:hypothetical protein
MPTRRRGSPFVQAALLLAALALGWPALVAPSPRTEAVERGNLRLAWDAHGSGHCREALTYLGEIRDDSALAGEAAWLRADCLLELGRFEEAVAFLEGPRGSVAEARDELLRSAYWDWAWDATGRETYDEALRILERARRALPADGALVALAEATRFRKALAAALRKGDEGNLSTGEAAALRPEGLPPRGTQWVRGYPWRADLPWVPQVTVPEWMPSLAERLEREAKVLWIRVPGEALERRLRAEAAERSLAATGGGGLPLRLSDGEGSVLLSTGEWSYRAASEGLGVRGAAASAAAWAAERLADRRALLRWLQENRRELSVEPGDEAVLLRHPRTGRTFLLDPAEWAGAFRGPGGEWAEFWADLQAELAKPARPYRCFCGREVFVRAVLLADPGEALVLEKGPGFTVVAAALCPLHHQYVTPALARSWGEGAAEIAARIGRDAERHPWQLSFFRGEAAGRPYLVLEGEGASALGRSPELLLGALEGVDGIAARGRTVQVLAPSPTSLVVAESEFPDPAANAATARVLLERAARDASVERLDYRSLVRLPERSKGAFRLEHAP